MTALFILMSLAYLVYNGYEFYLKKNEEVLPWFYELPWKPLVNGFVIGVVLSQIVSILS